MLGRAVAWLGPAGNGTRAKLVLNNWLADLTEATAETLSFARQLDLDPAEIVDLLQSTPLGAPYAVQKARSMLGTPTTTSLRSTSGANQPSCAASVPDSLARLTTEPRRRSQPIRARSRPARSQTSARLNVGL